jgi:NAD(P)-dependent dehydrogenase (short-subunit alcohol dehydrogenase family)
VITGANRGLGLELARAYVATGREVIGGCRRPSDATELRSLTPFVHAVDMGDEKSIAAFAESVGSGAVDVLFNNAGVDGRSFGAADGERDVLQLSAAHFEQEMRVNAVGPMLLARALLPGMRAVARPRIVNVSSQIGSMLISSAMGRDVGYAASKAALNMITVKLAWRLRADGVIAIALHPGYLRTAIGGAGAEMDPAVAAVSIVRLVDSLTIAESGRFYRWDGAEHPW